MKLSELKPGQRFTYTWINDYDGTNFMRHGEFIELKGDRAHVMLDGDRIKTTFDADDEIEVIDD